MNATETVKTPAIAFAKTRLQWGRRVNATETVTVKAPPGSAVTLQWGRRVNATETVCGESLEEGTSLASMGPSRECDGDTLIKLSNAAVTFTLQWGRRVNATETCLGDLG